MAEFDLRILFICTSNKDRSPALAEYFSKAYEGFTCKSAGINKYFCGKHRTHLVTWEDVSWASFIVFCEDIHKKKTAEILLPSKVYKTHIVLNCGEYKEGHMADDSIARAEDIIMQKLKKEFSF